MNAIPKLTTTNIPIHTFQSFLIVFQSVNDDVVDATLDTNFVAFFVTLLAARCMMSLKKVKKETKG